MVKIDSSEITPEQVYLSRRKFMTGMSTLALGSLIMAACGSLGVESSPSPAIEATPSVPPAAVMFPPVSGTTDELGASFTPLDAVTGYNNYYEFTTNKTAVAELALGFRTFPWTVEVGGLVSKPKTFDIDELLKFPQEERICRLRCVETWSMVIPWVGFPLSKLLQQVEPMSNARYVRFETLHDPEQMPGQKDRSYPWPYVEGLRLDEAMHDLTILATGLYGKPLPPQDGAPVRLVVPWKYGFKSIKSVVKIDLVQERPVSLWMAVAPDEYGFWANVNPEVPHARWPQATERRIGETERRKTLLFNGYADEVASMYQPPDLREWYY